MRKKDYISGLIHRTICVQILVYLPLLAVTVHATSDYTITELQPASGDEASLAVALNAAGIVVGTSLNGAGQPQAIRWQADGTPTRLISSSSRPFSKAYDINDSNVAVGVYADNQSNTHACAWESNLTLEDLNTFLPATTSEAISINNAGDIAGFYLNNNRFPAAYLLEGGSTFSALSFGQAFSSRAFSLNQHGDLAGSCLENTAGHGFIKTRQGQNTLPNLATGSFGEISSLNNLGHAAGYSDQSDGQEIACIWVNGAVTNLGHLGGGQSRALGMNNFGKVVGSSLTSPAAPQVTNFDTNGNPMSVVVVENNQLVQKNNLNDFTNQSYEYETSRAFLWNGTSMQNLNDLIPADSGWILISAEDVNDQGWITGYGTYNDELRGFLLKPTTPPAEQVELSLPSQIASIPQDESIQLQVNSSNQPFVTRLFVNNNFVQNISSGNVSFNPNSLTFGNHTLRVETLDHENNVQATKEVQITLRDLFLNEWKERYFDSSSSADADDTADPDQDGLPNILEFAFNLNPDQPQNTATSYQQLLFQNGSPHFLFKRRKEFNNQNISYQVKVATNPGGPWLDASPNLAMIDQTSDGDTNPLETLNYQYTGAASNRLFFKVEVTHTGATNP